MGGRARHKCCSAVVAIAVIGVADSSTDGASNRHGRLGFDFGIGSSDFRSGLELSSLALDQNHVAQLDARRVEDNVLVVLQPAR